MWHYGCVKVTHKTILKDGTEYVEDNYGLHEVVDLDEDQTSWTMDPVTIYSDESKEDLLKWLRQAIKDIEKYDVLIDPDQRINDLREDN